MSIEKLEELAAELIGTAYTDLGRTPEQGFDCWGLYRWLRREALGDDLPCYSEAYLNSQDQPAVESLIGQESRSWLTVSAAHARPGDMLVFTLAGHASHVGCLLRQQSFIHAMPGLCTVRGSLNDRGWKRRHLTTLRPSVMIP